MAAAAVDQPSVRRPVLISRHSSCLPVIHTRRPVGKGTARRCRSASPPVKKRQNVTRCTTSPSERLRNSIDEICLSLRQDGSSQPSFRAPDVPRLHHRKPIIKQLVTNSYAVKQPKPCKVTHPSTSRLIATKVLPDKTNPVLASADLNGNLISINSSTFGLSPDTKARRIDVTGSTPYSQPVDPYSQSDYYSAEPLRKRKPSYSGSNIPSSSKVSSTSDTTDSVSPFTQLPDEMKLKIFSYLDFMEKGVCMMVCRHWCGLMREPTLWRAIDFRRFRLCYKDHSPSGDVGNPGGVVSKENAKSQLTTFSDLTYSTNKYSDYVACDVTTNCTRSCYSHYINRIEGFISFLIDVRPRVRWLAFSFDLVSDNWSATVSRFLIHIDLTELTYANINWRDTPVKPTRLDIGAFNCADIVSKARRRQRKYLDFLQLLSREAVNLETLLTPFTWYDRSTNYLTSFKRLKNLSLEKYFVFRSVKQTDLDSILNRIPTLEKLLLELWCSSSPTATVEYRLHSKFIRYLDLSQCRLFYVSSIQMPLLETLVIARRPIAGYTPASTCLADILRMGTPNLTRINNIPVNSVADLELDSAVVELLCKVCLCSKHKLGAAMDRNG